jgi:hypothetical protein
MIQTTRHTFVPSVRVVGRIDPVAPWEVIFAEPMLCGASWEFARAQGGPLTQRVLDVLEDEVPGGRGARIDTQSQDLMEGQYPAIPGWHCDAASIPRDDAAEAAVYTCFVSSVAGGVSRTLFAAEPLTLDVDRDRVWGSTHRGAELFLMHRQIAEDGDVVRFDGNTLHRAAECHQRGWRYWFRLTMTDQAPRNAIKTTVQIYTPIESRG